MRGRLFITLIVLVLGAGTASATTAGRYVGYGGPAGWFGCASTTIAGPVSAGVLGDIDAATYQDCQSSGLTFEVTPHLPWHMNASSPAAYTIDDIEVDFAGPFCAGTVSGWAAASYDGSVLTVLNQATAVTYLDPTADCLGLISVGEPVPVLADSYDIVLM